MSYRRPCTSTAWWKVPRLWNGIGGVATAPAVIGTIWSQTGGSCSGHVARTRQPSGSSPCCARTACGGLRERRQQQRAAARARPAAAVAPRQAAAHLALEHRAQVLLHVAPPAVEEEVVARARVEHVGLLGDRADDVAPQPRLEDRVRPAAATTRPSAPPRPTARRRCRRRGRAAARRRGASRAAARAAARRPARPARPITRRSTASTSVPRRSAVAACAVTRVSVGEVDLAAPQRDPQRALEQLRALDRPVDNSPAGARHRRASLLFQETR